MLKLLGNRVRRFRNTPQTKLTDSAGEWDDQFGASVALSSDGNTALIGSNLDDVGAYPDAGSAVVFTRSGITWTEQAKLTDTDPINHTSNQMGSSVALSSDGNTAIVGVPRATWAGGLTQAGAAIVFTRSGSTWNKQAKLSDNDGAASDYFGFSVALSSDGNTAIVGVIFDNFDRGSAVVFTRSGTTWTQQTKLTDSGGAPSDNFGVSVALSSDGNTALIGAFQDTVGGNTNQGSAVVFTRSGAIWTQQTKLTDSSGAAYDYFGFSVDLSSDGNTALIGSTGDDIGANTDQGSAFVFTRSGTTWTQQAKLTDSGGAASDYFGGGVALSGDGNTALISSPYADIGANPNQGSAVVFTRKGSTWTQQPKLTDSGGAANDRFGRSVALSSNGKTALIGSPEDDTGAGPGLEPVDQGSAIVFYRR